VLLRTVSQAIQKLGLQGRTVVVAVSGGVDSVCLLTLLHELAEEYSLKLLIGHVNHGLRGAESEADQAAVQALGQALGVPVVSVCVDPKQERQQRSSRDRPTLQEAARRVRYRALESIAEEHAAHHIATAHNADDQAETVLLRLLRGTGPDGLAGIPEASPDGRIVRPLLRASRVEIEQFARQRHLSWREDRSNQDTDYARNRLRLNWIPGLAKEFNPQLLRAIGNLAEAQRRDSEWINARVAQETAARFEFEHGWLSIDSKDWDALPEALARRVARAALDLCGTGRLVSRVHLERMLDFLNSARPGTAIELPGDLKLYRERSGYRLGPVPASTAPLAAC